MTRHAERKPIPETLEAFPEEAYRELPLVSLAAYAIAVLDEQAVPLTIENISVALLRLFPAQFTMVGFPEYPDGMRANRTLLQMQPKYRNYATGSAKRGYSLTALGRKVAEATRDLLTVERGTRAVHSQTRHRSTAARGEGPARTVHDEDLIARIRGSLLFQSYIRGELDRAPGVDFLGMLDLFSHTPKDVVRRELKHLEEAAERQEDQVLQDFLRGCRKRFSAYIHG